MGAAAGASISHLHLHIIPRYPRETGIADQADDIGFAAQEFNALLLAESEFAQPVAQFGRCGQFLDANGRAGGDMAQGTDRRPGTMAFNNLIGWHPFFHGGTT